MARSADQPIGSSLDLDGTLDRVAQWIGANPGVFLAGIGAVLLLTGGVGVERWWAYRSELRAAEAVAEVRAGFVQAMGAPPGALEFTEPANAETARKAREEYAARFATAAQENKGTAAAVDAWITAGNLQEDLGNRDAALDAWKAAVAATPGRSPLRGLALERLATAYESRGTWPDAAATHAEAGEIAAFPLRYAALADAARCFVEAGDRDRATQIAARIQTEKPDLQLPEHLRTLVDELAQPTPAAAPPAEAPPTAAP